MSTIHWTEAHNARSARWHSESAAPPPGRIAVADDRMKAGTAYRLACEGTALLWRGDYHNARQALRAMSRRVDRRPLPPGGDALEAFHIHRRARGDRARVLGRLVVVLDDTYALDLRRAPDVRHACTEACGTPRGPMAVSLTELLGVIGAHQWRLNGVVPECWPPFWLGGGSITSSPPTSTRVRWPVPGTTSAGWASPPAST